MKNRGLEEVLGATWRRKIYQKLSCLILVNFGRARIDQNLAQMGQDGPKLEPRWRQDPPSWAQDGHLEAIWGVILNIFGGLGSDLCEFGRSVKLTKLRFVHFGVLGGLVGCSREYFGRSWPQVGLSRAILASSWELLGNMLGLRWPKMA